MARDRRKGAIALEGRVIHGAGGRQRDKEEIGLTVQSQGPSLSMSLLL